MGIARPLASITESDLQALVDNGVPEDRQLEYKRQLHSQSASDRKEFCDDLASFANAIGGDILFGVEEDTETHVAASVPGVDAGTAEDMIRSMEQRIIAGVKPRIHASFRAVPLANGNCVIVGRVAPSSNSPHMTTIEGATHFCIRDGSGKHRMDVEELRQIFMQQAVFVERARSFVQKRVDMIAGNADDLPATVPSPAKMVVHAIPANAFVGDRVDVHDISMATSVLQRSPFGEYGSVPRPNLDGLVYPAPPNAKAADEHYYAQVFYNGTIEIVNGTALSSSDNQFYPESFERDLFQSINWIQRVYRRAQVLPPVHLFVTLLGVRTLHIVPNIEMHKRSKALQHPQALGRDTAKLHDVTMENLEDDPPVLMKPVFDQIWNGFGWSQALTYDDDGAYLGTWCNSLPEP